MARREGISVGPFFTSVILQHARFDVRLSSRNPIAGNGLVKEHRLIGPFIGQREDLSNNV